MDLRLFHHKDRPNADYETMDRKNSRTGSFHVDYLEWTGWYDTSVHMRLLGHYRLFQQYKKHPDRNTTGLSPEYTYIVYYREKQHLKYSWPQQLIPYLKLFLIEINIEVQSINQTLLTKRPDILQNFLVDADTDFDSALLTAIEQIHDPGFLSESPTRNVHLEIHQNHQHNNSFSKNEFHVHPTVKEEPTPPKSQEIPSARPAKGKEKDVFSKRQTLILFDLLATTGTIEPINLHKPNKFPAVAHLLRAITGKSEDSWKAELEDYRNKDLYAWHSDGERRELIRILINLAEKFGEAGFKTIAKAANQKIRELERAAP